MHRPRSLDSRGHFAALCFLPSLRPALIGGFTRGASPGTRFVAWDIPLATDRYPNLGVSARASLSSSSPITAEWEVHFGIVKADQNPFANRQRALVEQRAGAIYFPISTWHAAPSWWRVLQRLRTIISIPTAASLFAEAAAWTILRS